MDKLMSFFKALATPIISALVTILVTFAWNQIMQPTGSFSYFHKSQEITKVEVGSNTWLGLIKKRPPELLEGPFFLHQFDIFPRVHNLPETVTVRFNFPKGVELSDREIKYIPQNEEQLRDPKKDILSEDKSRLEVEFPGEIKRIFVKLLLNTPTSPFPRFVPETGTPLPPKPIPWDFIIVIVMIIVIGVISWNYYAREHLKPIDYGRISIIILVVSIVTPLFGGMLRLVLAVFLGVLELEIPPMDILKSGFVVYPIWTGAVGTFLWGMFAVAAAELVWPLGENATLSKTQGLTIAGLLWGLFCSFLISVAYGPEGLEKTGWYINNVRYGWVVTGTLIGLGMTFGVYVGDKLGNRVNHALAGRAIGAIIGVFIFLIISMIILPSFIFVYQDEATLKNLISRSCGDALSQWWAATVVIILYYCLKARLESIMPTDRR